jgi:hypothetical protein
MVHIAPTGMRGKPFQSKLEPHFDFIVEARRKRQTWQAIAQALAGPGTTTTPQAVHGFIKRRLKRRNALGMAPATRPIPQPETSSPEQPEFAESTPLPSEFTGDPLTQPPKGKTKATWTVFKPNT